MKPPQALLELPFSFTQLRPLMPHQFVSEARERGVSLDERQLEDFHRLGLLVPFLRVRRDGRAIAALARSQHVLARQVAHWHPTDRVDLADAAREQRLFDPAAEPFIGRARLAREIGDLDYRASEYLYSHHQLLRLPTLKAAQPYLRRGGGRAGSVRLDVNKWWRRFELERERSSRPLVIALSALEPIYYPRIVRTQSFSRPDDFEGFDRWRRKLRPGSLLRFLGLNAAWLRDVGAGLLHRADGLDPLGSWLDLVREADPESWKRLKHEARTAIDLRIAAEILLGYYDDLVKAGRAPTLPKSERWRGEFDARLKPKGPLDRVLTDFGLSPHPRLVLVVEGATEELVFPRLMERFGIRRDDDYISIQNAEGIKTGLGPLVAYALGPRTEPEDQGRYLRLLRPPTRMLVVTDAEPPMTSAQAREARRQIWVGRILRTLPKQHHTPAARDALENLVFVETWDRRGQSFEFANFTDRQLAEAIASLDQRPRQPTLDARIRQIATLRSEHSNIKKALGPISKLELADRLWTVLEAKIARAERHKTEADIPVVRVLDQATDLARQLRRRNVVIPLRGD